MVNDPTLKLKNIQRRNLSNQYGSGKGISPKTLTVLSILACILLPTIIYYNSLHAPFIFDDIGNIVANPDIKQLGNVTTRLIYRYNDVLVRKNDPARPLTFLTFMLNYHFWGLDTFGYHLVNIIVHILTTILVFFLTMKVFFYLGICTRAQNIGNPSY